MNIEPKPYFAGVIAQDTGKDFWSNPYSLDTAQGLRWARGFFDACDEQDAKEEEANSRRYRHAMADRCQPWGE